MVDKNKGYCEISIRDGDFYIVKDWIVIFGNPPQMFNFCRSDSHNMIMISVCADDDTVYFNAFSHEKHTIFLSVNGKESPFNIIDGETWWHCQL